MTALRRSAPPARAPAADADARPLTGVLLMTLGTLAVPGMDAMAKHLATAAPAMAPAQIGVLRFAVQIVLLGALGAYLGGAALRLRRPGPMAARGLALAGATICFFTALQHMPMAETVAIFFVEPLILTVLSALLLGERIGWRRKAAIAAGLAGALLIIRPNFVSLGPVALLPLGAAFCFAAYLLLTKRIAGENAVAMQFWAAVFGGGALALASLLGAAAAAEALVWTAPTPGQWALLAALGVVATGGHMLITLAFRHAPASTLAPLTYLEIVGAVALGWLVFGEFPDPRTEAGLLTWAGILLIVASGLFVIERRRRLGGPGAQPTADAKR